ncbi:DUF968 domain-containing protein [Pasteurella multocida]|nr:DUF968 domain-containing protein [Pasteurella multocida]MDY0438271.1 DUF968 domain-containing protein [Pasteurella multocida]MDY0440593.1 DUF968 domain-containing protein [Pasteurella multocida]MDY0444804.1 DUF968 domain-containing protein [Pasteurella multocida]MDY0447061.1 DUF968 domain-containing protein [Pasteurella multocida]
MRCLLLTPYIQNDLNIVFFRLPKTDSSILKNRVLLCPPPAGFENRASGVVDWDGFNEEPKLNKLVDQFLCSPTLREKIVKENQLFEFVSGMQQCQLSDNIYCHHELTVSKFENGFIKTCWHHDNELRASKIDEKKVRSVLEENIKKFLIHKIQTDLRHHREVTVSDCVLFACKNQVPLLEEVTRYFFKLPDLIDDGKESSVGFNKDSGPYISRLRNSIISLKVDDDPPAQYMRAPKPQYIRSEKWLRWVKSQPCVCCGKQADDPHHLINQGGGIMGSKADDMDCIPLCRIHHNELHQNVKEFERKYGSQVELWHKFFLHSIKIGALEVS